MHNSHPLIQNLAKWGMKIDTVSLVCWREEEDGGHLLFKCKTAKHVWQLMLMEKDLAILATMSSPWEGTDFIMKSREESCLKKMVTHVWFLWSE